MRQWLGSRHFSIRLGSPALPQFSHGAGAVLLGRILDFTAHPRSHCPALSSLGREQDAAPRGVNQGMVDLSVCVCVFLLSLCLKLRTGTPQPGLTESTVCPQFHSPPCLPCSAPRRLTLQTAAPGPPPHLHCAQPVGGSSKSVGARVRLQHSSSPTLRQRSSSGCSLQ